MLCCAVLCCAVSSCVRVEMHHAKLNYKAGYKEEVLDEVVCVCGGGGGRKRDASLFFVMFNLGV